MTLDEILELSPDVGGGKMAFYSVGCCWWTSFPEDLGKLPPMKFVPMPPDGSGVVKGEMVVNPGGHSLPCCPHCKSVLMQAPLEKFIETAKSNPEHYGKFGLEMFTQTHERNSKMCFPGWKYYEVFIEPF